MGGEHISFEVRRFQRRFQTLDAQILTLFPLDCKNRFPRRCHRITRPRRTSCLLLSRSRSQGVGVLFDSFAFQDQANLRDTGNDECQGVRSCLLIVI